MKNIIVLLLVIASVGCEEQDISSANFDDCVRGTVVSTGACTGNGVIISVETRNRSINKELEKYGDQKEITVFDALLSEAEIGDQVSFRILNLVDTARTCLMLWESPRGPEARVKLDCD